MRVLGLDLGTNSVKAVEYDAAFSRYELHDYHEVKLAADQTPAQGAALLIHSLPKKPDRIANCLSSQYSTFRNLTLPTRDRRAIRSGIAFELEDELPFDPDLSIYDYALLSQGKQSTHVHIGATLKETLTKVISDLKEYGVDPDVIVTESWVYRTLLNRTLNDEEKASPKLLVHMGKTDTTIYIHWKNYPIVCRKVAWGGQHLTRAIIEKYEVSEEEAEKAKLDNGFILSSQQRETATVDQREFSDTLLQATRPLLLEMRQAELTCKNLTHENISSIYMSGGPSLLPGLRVAIEEELGIHTQPFKALSLLSTSGMTYSEATDAGFLLAASTGLCLVGPERTHLIDLRQGEFEKGADDQSWSLKNLKYPLLSVGAITLCFFLGTCVESHLYQSRIASQESRLEKAVRQFFGNLGRTAVKRKMKNSRKLKKSVQAEISKYQGLAELTLSNPTTPLRFLKKLSQIVPKNVVVDMTEFSVGTVGSSFEKGTPGKAQVSFLIHEQEKIPELSSILNGLFVKMTTSKPVKIKLKEKNKDLWKITFSGDLIESAYD
ncbi:MAG: hypothetical protein CL678_05045 [Bdellovibrionaceae bacterium]|nr:hypothetical protein [Pseudobdellovibrionaceae bacterium]